MRVSCYLTRCLLLMLLGAASGSGRADAFIIDPSAIPWTTTASGSRTQNGQSVTLTWSIVPDGSAVSDGDTSLGGSDLIAFLNTTFQGDPNETDHRNQPWFGLINDAFQRWSDLSGATYIYEPNDDGGNHDSKPGLLNVRGDVRLAGASVDGSGQVLAFNYFPEFGGDMVLDTDDGGIFGNAQNNYVRFRNTIAHEHGHGFGLEHVLSDTDQLLMEPSINAAFDGPRLDEIRGVHFYFGDRYEKTNSGAGNGTVPLATPLGSLEIGQGLQVGADANVPTQAVSSTAVDFVSISNLADIDVFSFSVSQVASLTSTLVPLGGTFTQSDEFGVPSLFDANARSDLSLSILASNGTSVLAAVDNHEAGIAESISALILQPGDYFARIRGADDTIQLYMLDLSLAAPPGDFNLDGMVDAADYTIWQDALGDSVAVGASADGNLNGIVDADDYFVWRDNFGINYNIPNSVSVVPEPLMGLWLWFFIVPFVRRLRQARAVKVFCMNSRNLT